MTQCFCRGVCRGACECANLLDHANKSDPTAAEAIKTAPTAELSLSFGLQLLQAATLQTPLPADRAKMQADNRDVHNNKGVVQCPQNWTLYGNRGRDARVHSLSAYEFTRYYHCRQAYFPWTAKDQDQAAQAAVKEAAASTSQLRNKQRVFHAQLSDSGKQKRADKVSKRNLQAGVDYVIQNQGGEDWMPLGKGSLAQAYRHDWIISPRKRPHAPPRLDARRRLPHRRAEALRPELRLRVLPAPHAAARRQPGGEQRQRRHGGRGLPLREGRAGRSDEDASAGSRGRAGGGSGGGRSARGTDARGNGGRAAEHHHAARPHRLGRASQETDLARRPDSIDSGSSSTGQTASSARSAC